MEDCGASFFSQEIRKKPREKLQLSRQEADGSSGPGSRAHIVSRTASTEEGGAGLELEARAISGS